MPSIGYSEWDNFGNAECMLVQVQWKGINRKQITRWQHLSQLKASAFFSLQKNFSCYETQQLILGTGTAIWWVTEPHSLLKVDILWLSILVLPDVLVPQSVFKYLRFLTLDKYFLCHLFVTFKAVNFFRLQEKNFSMMVQSYKTFFSHNLHWR